nr:unnamed protein product [Callosobruchus chinensis]
MYLGSNKVTKSKIVSELQTIISSKPVLSIFDPKLKTFLYTDACQDSIGEYTFQIQHKAGTQMKHVDALSRNTENIIVTHDIMMISEQYWIKEAQDQDEK